MLDHKELLVKNKTLGKQEITNIWKNRYNLVIRNKLVVCGLGSRKTEDRFHKELN